MTNSMVIRCALGGLICLAVGVGFSAETEASIERVVEPGGPGGNRLEVDVALLAEAEDDFRDLRLVSAGGEEIPYLLLDPARAERRWKKGVILALPRSGRTSGFEVDLGEVVMIDRIRIEGLPAPFLKRVQLEAGGNRTRWTLLHEQATLFDLPDEDLSLLELDFRPGEYRYLRVVWSDRSSARLPLPRGTSVRLVQGASPPPPLEEEMLFEKRAGEPGRSRYRVFLPAGGLPIERLELEAGNAYVLRRARVTEARLIGSEIRPFLLGETTLRRVVREDLVASQMGIPISAPTESEVEIEVDDDDNPPLELEAVRARFSSQPWIYFESSDGEPIRARYGAPGLRAPSYDLEALKESLGSEGLAREVKVARFGESRRLVVAPPEASIADAVGGGANIDVREFQIRRAIEQGPLGLNAVRLDPSVLAGSSRLDDLRIVDGSSVQVPYILEKLGEPTIVDLPGLLPAPEMADERQSAYRLTLPHASLPAARLTVATTARVFERRVLLIREESRSRRDPPIKVALDEEVWRNRDSERKAPLLTLQLPALAGAEMLLIVDEGDNSPLQLASPKLYLPTYRLRFVRRNEEPLWLLYGQYGLAAPRYDLALLAPRVLGARVPEVALSNVEEELPVRAGDRIGTIVFWSALILALVVLFGLVARLLRRGPDG